MSQKLDRATEMARDLADRAIAIAMLLDLVTMTQAFKGSKENRQAAIAKWVESRMETETLEFRIRITTHLNDRAKVLNDLFDKAQEKVSA